MEVTVSFQIKFLKNEVGNVPKNINSVVENLEK